MRLSVIAVAVASAGIAQVAATPIRILIGSSHQEGGNPLDGVRLGHPVPPPAVATWSVLAPEDRNDGSASGKRMRRPCHGRMSRINQKGIEISNAFRKALGLPLIDTKPQPFINGGVISGGFVHIRPVPMGSHERPTNLVPGFRSSSDPFPHHHHGHHGHRGRNGSFTARLNHSLMNLGRWEGRAVAFVLGCGIGVLLRMFWVLAIVTYRAIKGHREDEPGYSHITIIEEYDDMPALTPPAYIYPVDEKVAVEEEETPKAPVSTEESK